MEISDFLRVFLGAFFGASFAFLAQWLVRQREREREEGAAGNMAIVKLGLMINAYAKYRMKALEGYNERNSCISEIPIWLKLLPITHQFDESLRFDLKSLSFLFGVRTVEVMNKLLQAEIGYHFLVNLHKAHFEAMTELQAELSKLHLNNAKKTTTYAEMARNLPPHLMARVESLNIAILQSFDEDEPELHKAYTALYEALCITLGKPQVRQFSMPDEMLPHNQARN